MRTGEKRWRKPIAKVALPLLLFLILFLPAFGLGYAHLFGTGTGASTFQYLNEAPISNAIANVPNPIALAYSSERGDILVASSSYQMIAILEHGTFQDVLNISLGATPTAVAWDSIDGTMYSATSQGSVISIDSDTLATVGNASVPSPVGMFYDSVKNRLYVASSSTNSIYVINASSTKILKMINLCCSLSSLVYDSGNGYLYVTESASNTVAAVNPVTNSTVANISVGSDPKALVSEGRFVYVANYNSNSVSVIDTFKESVSETIGNVGPNPDAIAYNSYNGCFYVADYGGSEVSQICSGALNSTITAGSEPDALVYDPVIYSILVANYGSGTISEISTQGTPSLPTKSSTSVQNTVTSFSQSGTLDSTNSSISSSFFNSNESSSSTFQLYSSLAGAQPNYSILIVVIAALVPEIGILLYFKRRGT